MGGVVAVALGLLVGWSLAQGRGPLDLLLLLHDAVRARAPISDLQLGSIPLAAALIFALHARSAAAFLDRARRLTYAITDRRLLILLDDRIEAQFAPEDTRGMELRQRTDRHGDLLFRILPRRGKRRGEGLASRERRHVGFKALPDAAAMRARIEAWRAQHLARQEAALGGFLQPGSAPPAPRGTPGPAAPRRIAGGRHGLAVEVPGGWDVHVRYHRRPFGTTFLDDERWRDPQAASDWNVLRATGPFGTRVTVHVDAVGAPTSRLERAGTGNALVKLVAGEVLRTSEDVVSGRFRGWSVTRQHRRSPGDGARDRLDEPNCLRTTTLYDGVVQLAFVSSWPAGAPALEEAVDRIEASASVHSEGVRAAGTGPGTVSRAGHLVRGTVGALLTSVRILFGLMLLVVGVWAG